MALTTKMCIQRSPHVTKTQQKMLSKSFPSQTVHSIAKAPLFVKDQTNLLCGFLLTCLSFYFFLPIRKCIQLCLQCSTTAGNQDPWYPPAVTLFSWHGFHPHSFPLIFKSFDTFIPPIISVVYPVIYVVISCSTVITVA